MFPAFGPGDHVLIFSWCTYKVGDVIVFRQGQKNYIKRIIKILGGLYYVAGDNKISSVQLGPIKKEKFLGKVTFKY